MAALLKVKQKFGVTAFFSFAVAVFIGLYLVLSFYGVSAVDYLKFVLGLLFFVYIPGQTLIWLAKLSIGRFQTLILSLVIGLAVSTTINKFSRLAGLEFLFFIWLALAFGYFLYHLYQNSPKKEHFNFRITFTGIIFVGIILIILVTLILDNYGNMVSQPDGSVVVNFHYYDGFIRNAVVREVTHTVPPQMPFAAGLPIGYHYGMDLFLAMFHRYLGIGVPDMIHRFSLTLFFFLLAGSVYVLLEELSSSKKSALLGLFLVVFGSGGFAYMVTYFLGIYQWGGIFYSLYYFILTGINSFLPAVIILLAAGFCLNRFSKTEKTSWMIFTALLFALSIEFKMFFFGPLMGALVLIALLMSFFRKKHIYWRLLFFTSIFMAPLLILAYVSSLGGPEFTFRVYFIDWIRFSLRDMELTTLMRSWGDIIHRGQIRFDSLLAVIPSLAIFFAGGMGLSILAVPFLLKDFFNVKKSSPLRIFLILLCAGLILYFLFIEMSQDGQLRNSTNIYAYYFALILLSMLWAEKFMSLIKKYKSAFRIGLLFLVIGLSVPNTIRFVIAKHAAPQAYSFPASLMEAAEWMHIHSESEDTILTPLRMKHVCYFMNRRVVMDNSPASFITWHLTEKQIDERSSDVKKFFSHPKQQPDILNKYSVSWIMTYSDYGFLGKKDLIGTQIPLVLTKTNQSAHSDKQKYILELVFKNKDYTIFKVIRMLD